MQAIRSMAVVKDESTTFTPTTVTALCAVQELLSAFKIQSTINLYIITRNIGHCGSA